MRTRRVRQGRWLAAALAAAVLSQAEPATALTIFQNNLAGFNAAAGNPPIVINFDGTADNTNLAGQTISGLTFSSPSGNSLLVVSSTQTVVGTYIGIIDASTNKLFPTSGTKVLSPGGSDLVQGPALAEQDDLQMVLSAPQQSFGLDILFQSLDCCLFMKFDVFDAANQLLASGGVQSPNGAAGGAPGGSVFLGFVSDSANIAKIILTDQDGNNEFPDNNMGYDTIRFGTQAVGVPEPGTLLMVGLGLAGVAARSRAVATRRGRRHSRR